jgi:hypothetical protein
MSILSCGGGVVVCLPETFFSCDNDFSHGSGARASWVRGCLRCGLNQFAGK